MNDYSAPQAEEDTMQVRKFFERAVNAMVDASELFKEVQSLKASIAAQTEQFNSEIAAVNAELQNVRDRNTWLDRELETVTQERNEAKAEAESTSRKLADSEQMVRAYESENATLRGQLADLQAAHDKLFAEHKTVTAERDEIASSNVEMAQRHQQINQHIEQIRGLLNPPSAVPVGWGQAAAQ